MDTTETQKEEELDIFQNLPDDLGGYQALADDEYPVIGDLRVMDGKPYCWNYYNCEGDNRRVSWFEDVGVNFYRKIPVVKGGDLDIEPTSGKTYGELRSTQAEDGTVKVPVEPVMDEAPKQLGLPTDAQQRKDTPVFSGVLAYFPHALAEVAKCSKFGNDKHNPGQPLHWSKGKSNDHLDALTRHLLNAGQIDPDSGLLEDTLIAWRGLANLEIKLEALRDS